MMSTRSLAATALALSAMAFWPATAVPAAASPLPRAATDEQARTGPQVLTDAISATTKASSFHVVGHTSAAGAHTSVNLSLSPAKGGGTITENGATLQVVVIHQATVYVKADAHSWKLLTSNASTAKELANKWVQLPASTPGLSNVVTLTVPSDLVHTMLPGKVVGLATKLGMGHWDGRPAVVLGTPGHGQFYVSDKGAPYLLHVQLSTSSVNAYYSFTDFGRAPMPSVPVNFIKI